MALRKDIITFAEADIILTDEEDWFDLTNDQKESHIGFASVFMQQKWTCANIDWDDDTTISSDINEACAYYALASLNGTLYPKTSETTDLSGRIIEQTDKVGSLQSTTKWDTMGGKNTNPLQYPDALMGFECVSSRGVGSVKLTRV